MSNPDERKQWTWAIVSGGTVWHAFADGAPRVCAYTPGVRSEFIRWQSVCGVWRRTKAAKFFGHEPPGTTCESCRTLWDEHYTHWEKPMIDPSGHRVQYNPGEPLLERPEEIHWILHPAGPAIFLMHDADPRPAGATVFSGYEVVATFSDSNAADYVLELLRDDIGADADDTIECQLCLVRKQQRTPKGTE